MPTHDTLVHQAMPEMPQVQNDESPAVGTSVVAFVLSVASLGLAIGTYIDPEVGGGDSLADVITVRASNSLFYTRWTEEHVSLPYLCPQFFSAYS